MTTRDEIEAVNQAYEKAVANTDIAAVIEQYSPDALLLAPNAPLARGKGEIQAILQGFLDAGANGLELKTIDLDDHGDIVVEIGAYTLQLAPPDGDPITDVGKYLQVFKRQSDGSFRIAYDAFNSDQPA